MSKQYLKNSIKGILYASSGLSLAMGAHFAQAQDDAQQSANVEEVIVLGVRQSLETAVEVKRNASAIVDHISADDISGFPALDLGETLQAIPGIQLNRDSERRQSEVSLRGFSGGFILQTANGNEFANPTRSQSLTAPNPFGAFESGVFSGVTVYKTLQADLIEGGIAGVIDKKLPDALSKEGTGGSLSLGSRYEHLNDSYDPEYQLSGWTHLIEDELAVSFKLAGSTQKWRKDVFITPNYDDIENQWVSPVYGTTGVPIYDSYADYKEAMGVAPDAVIRVPSSVRQVTEANEGDRISFSGNIAWQATEELKLDMDVLYTNRNMDQSELEQFNFEGNRGNTRVRPLSNPFLVAAAGTLDEDTDQFPTADNPTQGLFAVDEYVINDYQFENGRLDIGNREFDFVEQSQGVFFGAEWISGPWTIEANASISSAENDFRQVLLGSRLRNVNIDDDEFGNGLNGRIAVLGTNLDRVQVSLDNATDLPLLDFPFVDVDAAGNPILPGNNVSNITSGTRYRGGQVNFGIGANTQTVDRDMTTFDLSGAYEVDMPFFSSIKAGVRVATDELVSDFLNNSLENASVDLIGNDLFILPYSATGGEFFNGLLGDHVTYPEGWVSINVNETVRRLQSRGIVPEGNDVLNAAGFIARDNPAGGQAGQNFNSQQDAMALFVMGNIDHEIGDMPLTGNIGVRFVNTEVTANGLQLDPTDRTVALPFTSTNDYDNVLPSMNLVLEPAEDWIARFSFSRGMTRPNLKGVKPSLQVRVRDRGDADPTVEGSFEEDEIEISLPESGVEALTADSLDLSVEWYNRDGSNIGIALFQKNFQGKFTSNDLCPSTYTIFGQTMQLALDNNSRCAITNTFELDLEKEDAMGNPEPPEVFEFLDLSERVNSSEEEEFVGFELYATQNLDFLPGFWSGFGMSASYTHLENKDDANFYSVSEDSANFVGYWENEVFSMRLSANWRSDYRLNGGGGYQGRQERIVEGRTQIDLMLGYEPTFVENVKFTFQAFNMTDELLKEHDYRNANMLRRLEYPGRTYAFKASYTF